MMTFLWSVVIVLPWLLVLVGIWLVRQFLIQNGRILLRLDAIEQRLIAAAPRPVEQPGLSIGEPAPDFDLADLSGEHRTLANFRGRKLLVVFFNPDCSFCVSLAPALAELPVEPVDGHPLPLVISSGSRDALREFVEEAGLKCPLLLAEQSDVGARYRVQGTPTGYLIDEEGRIASARTVGGEPLLVLTPRPVKLLIPGAPGDGPDVEESAGSANGSAPRLAVRAWNLARAMTDFAADGMKTLTAEQYRSRLEICDRCDRRRGTECLECGCF